MGLPLLEKEPPETWTHELDCHGHGTHSENEKLASKVPACDVHWRADSDLGSLYAKKCCDLKVPVASTRPHVYPRSPHHILHHRPLQLAPQNDQGQNDFY